MPKKYDKKACETCEYWCNLAGGQRWGGTFGCLQILDTGRVRKIAKNGRCLSWKQRGKTSKVKAFRIG